MRPKILLLSIYRGIINLRLETINRTVRIFIAPENLPLSASYITEEIAS